MPSCSCPSACPRAGLRPEEAAPLAGSSSELLLLRPHELQALYETYREHGFTILAFPCGQFGGQEFDTSAAIKEFVASKGVSFPLFEKIKVNGDDASPVFAWLKKTGPAGFVTSAIKWNFSKFLVVNGAPMKRYGPSDAPYSFEADIREALAATGHTALPPVPVRGSSSRPEDAAETCGMHETDE